VQEPKPDDNWLNPGPGITLTSWQFMQDLSKTMAQQGQSQAASVPLALVTLAPAPADTSRLVQIRWGTQEPIRLPSARVRAFGILTCVQDPQHEGELPEPLYMQLKASCVQALQEALARQQEPAATDSERAARAAEDMSADLAARCAEAGLAIQSLAIEGMMWEQETEAGATPG
jgi:hypothetical protein